MKKMVSCLVAGSMLTMAVSAFAQIPETQVSTIDNAAVVAFDGVNAHQSMNIEGDVYAGGQVKFDNAGENYLDGDIISSQEVSYQDEYSAILKDTNRKGVDKVEENMSKVRDLLKAHIDEKEEWDFESADEYCYAVGQLMNTYLSLSKSANKNLSFINPLLQTTSNEMIKRTVLQMFKKYSYAINDTDFRIKNLYGHVIQYDMTGKEVNHYFLSAGFVDGNLVYTKKEKEEQ